MNPSSPITPQHPAKSTTTTCPSNLSNLPACPPWSASSGRPRQRSPQLPRYNEVASTAMRLLAEASTTLARIKASKRL